MKKVKRILSLLISASLGLALAVPDFLPVASAEEKFTGYDMTRIDSVLADFELALTSDDQSFIKSMYDKIIEEVDYAYYQLILSKIQYSQEMTSENRETYNVMSASVRYVVSRINETLSKAVDTKNDEYVFSLMQDGYIRQNHQYTVKKAEETEEMIARKNELLQKYIDVLGSSRSEKEKELACAEIYLDLAKYYNSLILTENCSYIDYAYQLYCRDYTADDIAKLNDAAAEKLSDAFQKITGRAAKVYVKEAGEKKFDDNFDVVSQFAYRVSDDLRESAGMVAERGLYKTGSGNSDTTSYTTKLNYIGAAVIYQYIRGESKDFSTTAHEFGHFNALRQDTTPYLYIHGSNLDIAEVQSQGLEVLYTDFYDSIYGVNDEYLRMTEAASLLVAIAGGFQGNEFENYVFEHADSMTPEDVVEKYHELAEKYKLYNVSFCEIAHFFQMPGYYISYAVSALAAIDLWTVMYRDFDRAAEMYTDISHISIYDGTGFTNALESAGFDNVLGENFITDKIPKLAEDLTDGIIYGDTDGNGIINTADITNLVKVILTLGAADGDAIKRGDLDCDGAVNASDLLKLKRIMSKNY